jgi:predicted lipoprotein
VAAAYLGDRNQFQIAVEGCDALVTVTAQNAAARESGFQPGEVVYLTWPPDAPVLLPAE